MSVTGIYRSTSGWKLSLYDNNSYFCAIVHASEMIIIIIMIHDNKLNWIGDFEMKTALIA